MSEGESSNELQGRSRVRSGRRTPSEHAQDSGKAQSDVSEGLDENDKEQLQRQGQEGVSSRLYSTEGWHREVEGGSSLEDWRGADRRDYARVIHSPSFRRLQGKTQLFPGHESDFFRNRLTHSLEVAQVAESIAYRLNETDPFFKAHPLKPRLCATAGLMHDLGHPPFGHNGEHALDDKMRQYGGFEGNAQTLRIITRLEKKVLRSVDGDEVDVGQDLRAGLNLTYRTIASALKYDRVIPHVRDDSESLVKGYYADDAALIERVKAAVDSAWDWDEGFKTIECSIMDVADDIAYSTYDLEDSLKAGFLTPASILSSDRELLERVAKKVAKATDDDTVTAEDVLAVFWDMFAGIARDSGQSAGPDSDAMDIYRVIEAFERSRSLAESGYLRTDLTSELVGEFINSVEVEVNEEFPALSKVYLEPTAHRKVETLKNYTYEATIFSTRLKVAEWRGYEVVCGIFDALSGSKGHLLMPDDVRRLYGQFESNASARMRVVCDFVAGMTDRYALEFYGRLYSDNPQSIFKPI